MTTPVLSVTVLNYNYGHYLERCLRSILAQSFTDFEVIVIDDTSSDNSLAVVEPFLADPRVRLVAHETNVGFAGSLIEGTEVHSRGEFLTVISADDLVNRPDAFATQVELLRRQPQAAFCFSAVERMHPVRPNELHHSFAEETVLPPREGLRALLLQANTWPAHSGTIIRRSAYEACGGYRRDITMPLDLALWMSLAMEGGFAYAPLPLYGYQQHDGQMSASLTGIRRNTREVAMILRDACRDGAARGLGTHGLARRAVRTHLSGSALFDAFGASRRNAGTRLFASLRECPVETITSYPMWVAAMRAALGDRLFSSFQSLRGGSRTARRAVARPTGSAR